MDKFNNINKFLLLLILFIYNNLAKAQNTPTIYQTFINQDPNDKGGQIIIVDSLTFKQIKKIIISPSQPERIVVTPNNKMAFATNHPFIDDKKGIVAVNLETGKQVKILEGISIYGAKLSPDGNLWVLLDESQEIVVLNPLNLEVTKKLQFNEKCRDIIFTPNGKEAYISFFTRDVFKINTINGSVIAINNRLPARGTNQPRHQELELSLDGKLLFVGSKNTVSILDAENLKIIDSFTVNRTGIGDLLLKITPDGKSLYVVGYLGSFLFRYDIENKRVSNSFAPPGGLGTISSIDISKDSNIFYINRSFGVSLLDVNTNEFISNVQTSTGNAFPNPFSSGGLAPVGDFSIGQVPTIQTTFPMTNQQITGGESLTIRWNTTVAPQSYAIASHKVELSTDGGVTFTTIPKAENLGADVREFTWQVPNIETVNKAQIRVSTVDLGAKRANSTTGNFSIIRPGGGQTGDTQAPMVVFLLPKGGERFTSGDNLQISWMSSDNVGVTSQDLSLSTDGGNTFPLTLASGLPGTTQSFSFPIPMSLQSDQSRLRLIVRDSAGNMAQSLTPSSFRIELGADTIAPVVTIAQPSANQKLIAGQAIDVKWQSTDNRQLASQALQLSLDGGNTFATLASFGASDNSFIINNIAELAMTNAQAVVRITATDSSGNIGQASVMFSMSSAITNATYQSKVLSLQGIGFISNASGSTTKLFVNEREITITPTMLSNNNLTIKGSKKKLGIVKGNNSVKILVDGVSSNTLSFNF